MAKLIASSSYTITDVLDGIAGKDGSSVYNSTYAGITANRTSMCISDLKPTVSINDLVIGSKVIGPNGDVFEVVSKNPNGNPPTFDVGPLLTNIKGTNGQTPYVHWAYSDNSDGAGMSTTDTGQRYIGHYSDYTQADSTDKTKYRWADRWANIEVGGENLVDKTGEPFVMGYGITNTTWNPETKRTRLTFGTGVERANNGEILPQGGIFESQNVIIKKNQTYTQAIRVATDATFLGLGDLRFTWFGPEVANSSAIYHRHHPTSIRKTGVNEYLIWSTVTWDSPDIYLRPFDLSQLHTALDFRNTGTYIEFYQPKLETGTIPTAHTLSENDVQSQIDSKADQALTLEQLNALNEKNQILEAELQAKASLDTFSEFEKAYQSFVSSNAENQAKSEADLVEAGRRIDVLVTQFGGLAELKTFIDTYMSSSNEGLIIGKNDASSTIKVSSDRISMFSAGKEVMYISQGVINIDNGIFTASVQIGKFRTEQYRLNADINVVRYVG